MQGDHSNYPQNQLLNPSISNNYLYQQHFQHLQQSKPQRQPQQLQQQSQIQTANQSGQQSQTAQQQLGSIPTPNTLIAASSLVPGGSQQRYVGNIAYVMQQQHPIYHQLNMNQSAHTQSISSSRSYCTNANVYTKQPLYSNIYQNDCRSGRIVSDMIIQPDSFRRISGLTSEVFRQIEAVEAQFDPSTLASQYAEMERRGEMIIRILSPTQIMPQWLDDTVRRYGDGIGLPSWIQFVEIIKRPGQTLGLYIREGDAIYTVEGVYISRIALESPVYQSGCLRVGDEVLAINFVDVSRMSLDDVVLIMSIPRRLILTIRSRPLNAEHILTNRSIYGTGVSDSYYDTVASEIYSRVDDLRKPVVVVKQRLVHQDPLLDEEEEEDVLAAASAAAEAGLLDDPSTAAAAAVAALQNPTPAKAAAAVAAVNEMVRSHSSLDLYTNCHSLIKASPRRRSLFTSDNLADLCQKKGTERYSLGYAHGSLYGNKVEQRNSLSSLYHGRLSTSGARSKNNRRLIRTSSEQILYAQDQSGSDPAQQIDHFLEHYQTFKQINEKRRRHQSLNETVKSSFSSQSLSAFNQELAIPLPGIAEAVAIARKRYLRGELEENTSYSDTETPSHRDRSFYRSNSLPRTVVYSHHQVRTGTGSGHRTDFNNRLGQYYSSKKSGLDRSTISSRPHSAIGNYASSQHDNSNEILSRMQRNLSENFLFNY